MSRAVHLFWVSLTVVALLATGAVAAAQGDDGWVGEYFNNATLTGSPTLVRADAAINFVWSTGSPDASLPADNFSARWTRVLTFASGTYRFTVRSDDGIRVYLDNRLVLDAWYDHAPDPAFIVHVDVTAGAHALRVEYYEHSGAALVSLGWELVSTTPASSEATWVAEFYNNTGLIAPAAAQRTETRAIGYNWGYDSPLPGVLSADNFSARWTGSPPFAAGTYTFTVHADDGVRLWVDNVLLIDEWHASGYTPPYTATVALSAGAHAVRVEYFELLEVAAIRVDWSLSQPAAPPPAPPPSTVTDAWDAQYFNSTTPGGAPVYSERIASRDLNLDWGSGSPAAPVVADNFSGRLTRTLAFDAGTVRFAVRVDDGVRFSVDGQLVLDEWHVTDGTYRFFDVPLSAGNHTLTVDFYEGVGTASVRLFWAYPRPALPTSGAVTASVRAYLLNVRNGPGTTYPFIGRVPNGYVFAVTGRTNTTPVWYRVNFGTMLGWVNANWVTVQGDINTVPVVTGAEVGAPQAFGTPTGLRVRATTNLNVRGGPGISFAIVGYLVSGADADVVGRSADGAWWEINFSGGRGWVSAAYVQREGNVSAAVPVTG